MFRTFAPLLLATVAATAATAHRPWFVPSITSLADTSGGITVDAAISNDLFYPDHFPLGIDGVKVWAPDGSMGRIENAARGRYRSTFDVAIDKPGTWKIGTADENVTGTYKVGGELWAIRRGRPGGGPGMGGPGGGARPAGGPPPGQPPRPAGGGEGGPRGPQVAPDHIVASIADVPAGATDLDLTQSSQRNEFYVTAGAPTTTVFAATGKGLEMVPVSHPDELVQNEPGRFRFLVDGKAAAGLKLAVVPGNKRFRAGEEAREVTTGADGVATVNWPVAGIYWLNATLSDDHPTVPRATKRRMSWTATVEVLAP